MHGPPLLCCFMIKPGRAGAPQQVQQHGLGLVFGRVPEQRVGCERGPTGVAGPSLEVGAVGDLHGDHLHGHAERLAHGAHLFGIGARLGAQPVVDVRRHHLAPGRLGQHHQGRRVGAARPRAHHRRARFWKGAAKEQSVGRRHRGATADCIRSIH